MHCLASLPAFHLLTTCARAQQLTKHIFGANFLSKDRFSLKFDKSSKNKHKSAQKEEMAGDLRKVDRLLTFARENGEAAFQTYPAYCNFKAKPKIAQDIIMKMIRGLKEIYFEEECIYWCEKINGKCKREDQYFVLSTLIVSYHGKNHNQALVIKYGHEALSLLNRVSNQKSFSKGICIL